jgi:serine/threonine-protein kinase RsbW
MNDLRPDGRTPRATSTEVTFVSQQQPIPVEREPGGGLVEVRLPADLSQIFIVRALMATVALRQDFDLDAVEDLKLAADEMCSTLVTRARPGQVLHCRLQSAGGEVDLLASAVSDTDEPIKQDTFGWRVLSTLTDSVTTWTTPADSAGHVVHVRITKARNFAASR